MNEGYVDMREANPIVAPASPPPRRARPPAAGIAEQLRRAIVECGLSARALAEACAVDPRVVSRFVAGDRDLYLETAAKLAAHLNLRLVEQARPGRRR